MRLLEARLQRPIGANTGAGRRIFDMALAAVGLSLLSPLVLAIAMAVLLEDGRPVFFSQIRLGQHGRRFRLYKFRKFRSDGGESDLAVTLEDDNRMTRLGRLLARTKLDELPQLWNILIGDMSVVGPRPESLAFASCFEEHYRVVLDFRPGIFGPNQVFFRNEGLLYGSGSDPETFYREVLFPLKARADLAYFQRRTMRGDLAWIARGICAVFGFESRRQGRELINAVEDWVRQNAPA